MDKIIRTRKYEENVSFEEIRNEVDYLSDLCEELLDKKTNFQAP